MSFIKQYWIAGLVLTLVAIHAVIIGYVRAEATRIKVNSSNEIPLGLFYVQSADRTWMSQLRVHIAVPPVKRMVARATAEHHRWYLHEAVEEKLRQLDTQLLNDPVLLKIKEEIKLAVNSALKEDFVERVLINDRIDLPVERFHYPVPEEPLAVSPTYTSNHSGASEDSDTFE